MIMILMNEFLKKRAEIILGKERPYRKKFFGKLRISVEVHDS